MINEIFRDDFNQVREVSESLIYQYFRRIRKDQKEDTRVLSTHF